MTLIKSISGIRGTIGGKPGENLTPLDVMKFTVSYTRLIQKRAGKQNVSIVVGRDARVSGDMINRIVCGTLISRGVLVTDIGLSTTPTVEMAVIMAKANGGIIITASHNPEQWNALKLLNETGEFITADDGIEVLKGADDMDFVFNEVNKLGKYCFDDSFISKHIESILALPLVDVESIREANFRVAVDAVNSTGGIVIPQLLNALGVKEVLKLYCEPNGLFPHNPEPLPENLTELSKFVKQHQADIGFAVDPDVDRLAMVMENGEMFGEEYTLVAVADYVLSNVKGNTVSNLSSTRALSDVTHIHGGQYFTSAVGEVNVVGKMKACQAVIGGEGNGGVIYPDLHYGRDALVGIALFLSHMAKSKKKCSELRKSYPDYYISKNKMQIMPGMDLDKILEQTRLQFTDYPVNTEDGVRIDFKEGWVHLRKSNTEPIIRIYSESNTIENAEKLAGKVISIIKPMIKN
ncbi:phosphoglucosamine mutase [candidate division KSB1 bacterium]